MQRNPTDVEERWEAAGEDPLEALHGGGGRIRHKLCEHGGAALGKAARGDWPPQNSRGRKGVGEGLTAALWRERRRGVLEASESMPPGGTTKS